MSRSWIATSARPSPCPGSRSQGAYGPGRVTWRAQASERRAPSAPVTASSRELLVLRPEPQDVPDHQRHAGASAAAEIIRSAAARSSAIGFSQRTCFPPRAAATVACSWSAVGRQTDTAVDLRRRAPRRVTFPRRRPTAPRAACARSSSASTTSRRARRPGSPPTPERGYRRQSRHPTATFISQADACECSR